MKRTFSSHSIFSLLFCTVVLCGCTTFEIKSEPDLCADQRLPSSERAKCIAHFEENNLKTYLDRAQLPEGGVVSDKIHIDQWHSSQARGR